MSCPASRVSLNDLTEALSPYFPNIPPDRLRHLLRSQLNSPYDESYESVSRAEASWFVLEAQSDLKQGSVTRERQIVMRTLQQLFFQGRLNWHPLPGEPKFPTQITECADGDTCKAFIKENLQCPPLPETLRFSAVDTPESFHSMKLNRVRDEVLQKLSLSPALAPLVQFRIQYLGKIASFVMKDFPGWLQSQGMYFAVSNSYVFTNNKYQGLWQAYGTFLRRIITLHAPPQAIVRYFQERLPVLMATIGQTFYREALAKYTDIFQNTPNAPAPLSPQTLLNPAFVYTPQAGLALASLWQNEIIPKGYGDDWTGALVIMGLAYYYPKYKNQHGEIYAQIQGLSQRAQIGFWPDLVFRVMDPQYLAPDPTPDPDV